MMKTLHAILSFFDTNFTAYAIMNILKLTMTHLICVKMVTQIVAKLFRFLRPVLFGSLFFPFFLSFLLSFVLFIYFIYLFIGLTAHIFTHWFTLTVLISVTFQIQKAAVSSEKAIKAPHAICSA